MKIDEPLTEGTLLRRYKRFLADVELDDGRELTVHCPNPGRMTTCAEPGRPVLISDSQNPKRKLRHTLEMIRMGRTWVGVNTQRPNVAVAGFVRAGKIPELAGYPELLTEVPYGEANRSRIDLLLRDGGGDSGKDGRPNCYVEIKNTTLRVPIPNVPRRYAGAFPDAVTKRGRKHLLDLADVAAAGSRAVLFFFVGRADCHRFRPADEVDPDYGETLREVAGRGVELLAYRMRFSPRRVEVAGRLPVDL